MNFFDFFDDWIKGEISQGKVMICVGSVLLLIIAFIVRTEPPVLRGLVIPLLLLVLVNLCYGSYLVLARGQHEKTVVRQYINDPVKTTTAELNRIKKDHRAFSVLKPVWIILVIISVIVFLLFASGYSKGVWIGIGVFFVGAYIIDSAMHERLKTYMMKLQDLKRMESVL